MQFGSTWVTHRLLHVYIFNEIMSRETLRSNYRVLNPEFWHCGFLDPSLVRSTSQHGVTAHKKLLVFSLIYEALRMSYHQSLATSISTSMQARNNTTNSLLITAHSTKETRRPKSPRTIRETSNALLVTTQKPLYLWKWLAQWGSYSP